MPICLGTPRYKGPVEKIIEDAVKEASIYAKCDAVNWFINTPNYVYRIKYIAIILINLSMTTGIFGENLLHDFSEEDYLF